jgi:hypothetical protein
MSGVTTVAVRVEKQPPWLIRGPGTGPDLRKVVRPRRFERLTFRSGEPDTESGTVVDVSASETYAEGSSVNEGPVASKTEETNYSRTLEPERPNQPGALPPKGPDGGTE